MNKGSMITWGGTIKVRITHPNKSFLKGKRNLAKPYAVSRQVKSCSRDTPPDSSNVRTNTVP